MQAVLIVIQLIVSVALVGVVLLQKSEGGALGMGGGGGGGGFGSLFSPRGAADTLTRTTAILAVLFFVTSLGLTVVALHGRPKSSILDSAPVGTTQPLAPLKPIAPPPGKTAPAIPAPH
ncbi:MAG TPA: preprotein translocase subunit SecG [Rhizomicrobium sp.]|jgi:preprotein translocase subunit SecG|nr:preprotein translocase subunit SecG [Rhizomicrobium sp.]